MKFDTVLQGGVELAQTLVNIAFRWPASWQGKSVAAFDNSTATYNQCLAGHHTINTFENCGTTTGELKLQEFIPVFCCQFWNRRPSGEQSLWF